MAKPTITEEVPTEFPLSLDEFLSEQKAPVETKAGLKAVLKAEGTGGFKLRAEWAALLEMYQTQPVSMTWQEWNEAAKGGN